MFLRCFFMILFQKYYASCKALTSRCAYSNAPNMMAENTKLLNKVFFKNGKPIVKQVINPETSWVYIFPPIHTKKFEIRKNPNVPKTLAVNRLTIFTFFKNIIPIPTTKAKLTKTAVSKPKEKVGYHLV